MTFRQIALPAIRTIAGLGSVGPDWSPAVAGFVYDKRLGRTEFVPVRIAGRDDLGRPLLDLLGRGSSASLMAMALADGIAMLPPDVVSIERGLPLRFESFVDLERRRPGRTDPGFYRCRQTLMAETIRIAASNGNRAALGATPSSMPPMKAPTIEPRAITRTNARFSPSTAKLRSRL